MENIKIFEKYFRKGMIVKEFEAFKRTHPKLLKCILRAMNEVLPQPAVISRFSSQILINYGTINLLSQPN